MDHENPLPTPGSADLTGSGAITQGQSVAAGQGGIAIGGNVTGSTLITAAQVTVIVQEIQPASRPQGWDGREPYVGLTAFREHQADLFFGRQQLINRLLKQLAGVRLLCLTGPSGSGKSSLIQAGLIPALRANGLTNSAQWLIVTFAPGSQPIESLAFALGRLARSPDAVAYLQAHGPIDATALHTQVEILLTADPEQRALIVVDQFEELFTQTKDEGARQQLLNLLTYAVQQPGGRVCVLLSLRSDFVSQCATYPDLRKLMSGHIELIGALEPEELTQAIILPALAVGVEVQPELAAQVINDMAGEPGALPLMEFALKDLFDAQAKQIARPLLLTRQAYLLRGGIQQALERHAEQTFSGLSQTQQAITRTLFMHLIEVGRGTVDTRRVATFAELIPHGIETTQVETIVQTLTAARLITTDDDLQLAFATVPSPELASHNVRHETSNSRRISLAHEKLIEAWPWLQQLVRENRAAIELQNQIGEDAVAWAANTREISYLYTGARLQTVQEQLASKQITLSAFAQQFIEKGVQEENKRIQEREVVRQREITQAQALAAEQARVADVERKRAEIQAHSANQLRRRAWWLVGLTALALLAASIAGLFFRSAQSSANVRATEVVQRSTAEAQAKHEAALRATEVVSRTRAQATAEAERTAALNQARLAKAGELAAVANREIIQPVFDPSLALLLAMRAVTMTQPNDNLVFVNALTALDGAVRRAPPTWRSILQGHTAIVRSAIFNHTGTAILTTSDDGAVRVWDARDSAKRSLFILSPNGDFRSKAAIFSPDDKFILTIDEYSINNTIARIWDARTGQLLRTLSGHPIFVEAAAFSPDSKAILIASNGDAASYIWDANTGHIRCTLEGHTDAHSSVFSPDGKSVLMISDELTGNLWHPTATARVWNADTGQLLYLLQGHTADLSTAVYSPDGQSIVTASKDHTARVWDAHTGQLLHLLQDHTAALNTAVYSSDSHAILTASDDHTVRIWDARTGELLHVLQGHNNAVGSAVFSPDGKIILTASYDHTVRLWDTATGQALNTLQGHTGFITSAVFSPDGKAILTASADQTARLWALDATPPLLALQIHTSTVNSAVFSLDGKRILSSSSNHNAYLWDGATGQLLHTLQGHTEAVGLAVFSPNGKYIVTASGDYSARIWDGVTGQLLHILLGHTDSIDSIGFSSDSTRFVTASQDDTARVWDIATGQLLHILRGHTDFVYSVAFSPDDKYIATAGGLSDQTARLWDAATGKLIYTLKGHTSYVYFVTFSPDGKSIATTGGDGTVRLWNVATGTTSLTLEGHTQFVAAAVFSPDGQYIATASDDHTARLWSVATGQSLHIFQGHTNYVHSVVFSPDGQYIATASADHTARLWSVATGQPLLTFQGHTDDVKSAIFSPDGQHILTASTDGTARTWFTSVDAYLAAARRLVQRDPPAFTTAERQQYGIEQ